MAGVGRPKQKGDGARLTIARPAARCQRADPLALELIATARTWRLNGPIGSSSRAEVLRRPSRMLSELLGPPSQLSLLTCAYDRRQDAPTCVGAPGACSIFDDR